MLVNFFDRNNVPVRFEIFKNEEDAKAWVRVFLQNNDECASADFWQDGLFYGTMLKGANV